jgi:hypothetical protein
MVTLVADGEGRGPEGFRVGFLTHLFARAGAVLLVADEQPDELPYELAAEHAAELRRHVVIVECPRSALGAWTEFAFGCGQKPENVACFISDPRLAEGFECIDLEDIPPAGPRGGVH